MPTLAQVRTRADNWLEERWWAFAARQETYFGNHGNYWQGLVTNLNAPEHTTAAFGDVISDNMDAHPDDQPISWADVFPEWKGIPVPVQLRVDVYSGPMGPGYSAEVTVRFDGVLYRRRQQYGPETWRNVAWHVVEEFTG